MLKSFWCRTPPRDSDPQKLSLGPNKYSLWRSPIEISWARVTFPGGRTRARRYHFSAAYKRVAPCTPRADSGGWLNKVLPRDDDLKAGFVGKIFPFPFYIRCRHKGGEKYCEAEKALQAQTPPRRPHSAPGGIALARHPSHGGTVPPLGRQYLDTGPAYAQNFRPLRWLLFHTAGPDLTQVHTSHPNFPVNDRTSWFFKILQAGANESQFVESLHIWGPGYPGYMPSQTLSANLDSLKSSLPRKEGVRAPEPYFDVILYPGGLLRGGSRELTPLETVPDPPQGTAIQLSLGNCCVNAVWAPLTLEPCGPQVPSGRPYHADLGGPEHALFSCDHRCA
jgi:hypothetical protein